MLEIGKHEIHVIGLSVMTSNDVGVRDIVPLWEAFLSGGVKEKLGDLASPAVFSVYSDYENGHLGQYKVTLGYAVNDAANVPAGLSLITIPRGQYQTYPSASHQPKDILAVWQQIWAKPSTELPRSYIADFDLYTEEGVTINIGCT